MKITDSWLDSGGTMTEQDFLKQYNIKDYERPSIATDIAVFSIAEKKEENYRKDPDSVLKLLLIRRDAYPYKDSWALPGGFLRSDETPLKAAFRELKEETGVEGAYLRILDIFGNPGRDPRGWIISNAYLALIDSTEYKVHAGSDAWEAEWFEIDVDTIDSEREADGNDIKRTITYKITLTGEDDVKFNTIVKRRVNYVHFHEESEYEIVENDNLAFDHPEIILRAFLALRDSAEKDGRIIFDFLPEYFTFAKVQKAFETVLGRELLVANFRRKMAEYVIETDKNDTISGHRPAKLFVRNVEKF